MKIGDYVETVRVIQFYPRIGCKPFDNCLVGDPSPRGVDTRCEVVRNGSVSLRYLVKVAVDGYLAWVSPEDVEPAPFPAPRQGT
jgi:hypothetical protein